MGIELANPFSLPDISFIGGDTQVLEFSAVHPSGEEVSLDGSHAYFSIIHYADRFSQDAIPVFSKTMDIKEGATGMLNVLTIKLTAKDTVELHNKYVYQITLISKDGDPEIQQGIMMISRNVDGARAIVLS